MAGRTLELPYSEFPWFEGASVRAVAHVVLDGPGRLRWPDLDVDLPLEAIAHPERFPLVSRNGTDQ